ncbi:MAG: hypothetical protein M5U09_19105 [Gammaproteobacteria bacterium]|nr:hypothetical protein [Gammaproteobacteria bacterium]
MMLIPGFETEADFDAADLDARLRSQAVDYLAVQVRPGPPLSAERHARMLDAIDRSGLYERVLDVPGYGSTVGDKCLTAPVRTTPCATPGPASGRSARLAARSAPRPAGYPLRPAPKPAAGRGAG